MFVRTVFSLACWRFADKLATSGEETASEVVGRVSSGKARCRPDRRSGVTRRWSNTARQFDREGATRGVLARAVQETICLSCVESFKLVESVLDETVEAFVQGEDVNI